MNASGAVDHWVDVHAASAAVLLVVLMLYLQLLIYPADLRRRGVCCWCDVQGLLKYMQEQIAHSQN